MRLGCPRGEGILSAGNSLATSELRLLERETELAAIRHGLERTERGSGGVLLVAGPAGVGKSRLLSAACEEARRLGVHVVAARAVELDRGFPFGLARELVETELAGAGEAERAQLMAGAARLAEPLLDPAGTPPADEMGFGLIRGLEELVRNLIGARGALLVAVDDLQWADEGSLRLLWRLAARAERLPFLLLGAMRSGERAASEELVEWLAEAGHATVLRPQTLSEAAVDRLVRSNYEPEPELVFVRACASATGGNPFLLRELLAALRADGRRADEEAARVAESLVPERVLRSVVVRLGRLGDEPAQLAHAVAVLGPDAPLRLAATLSELTPRAAERAADRLAAAGLMEPGEPLRFSHPLTAAAVLEDMPAFARAGNHRRAAALLARDGSPDERVASHLLAAPPGGERWTAEVLRAAAARAVERGDPASAARLLQRALAEPPPTEQRAHVLIELGRAETAAGAMTASEHVEAGLALLADPQARALALHDLARLRHLHLDFAGAVEAAERGLEDLGVPGIPRDEPRDALQRKLFASAVAAGLIEPALRGRVAPVLERLVGAALAGEPPVDPTLRALVALVIAADGGRADVARSLAHAALADDPLVDPASHGASFGSAAAALLAADDLEGAERAASRALDAALRLGDVLAVADARMWRALARLERGRLEEAREDAEAGLEPGELGWEVDAPVAAAALAQVLIAQGRLEEAQAALERGGTEPRELVLAARGRLALARGDAAGALADSLAAGDIIERQLGGRNPALCPWRSQAALAAARLGERTDAVRLADAELVLARATGLPRAVGVALRAAGLVHGGQRGLALLRESASILAETPAQLASASTLLELGAALRRAGERADAREPLRTALDMAERFGARPLAARARSELLASGARPRRAALTGVAALTHSEHRVANLAARGLTNREIARELYLAQKTVEGHLSRAYRKLGVGSRTELVGALAASDGGDRDESPI